MNTYQSHFTLAFAALKETGRVIETAALVQLFSNVLGIIQKESLLLLLLLLK